MLLQVEPKKENRSFEEDRVCSELENIFNGTFSERPFRTLLKGGAEEPFYEPAINRNEKHVIYYTRDYVASALHEIAHWCIAGEKRRALPDYGYWYNPDGRTGTQQEAFEKVEVKPQALEWVLSSACGLPFRLSADNLGASVGPSERFRLNVHRQVEQYCLAGLPDRAARLHGLLCRHFSTGELAVASFPLSELK